MTNGWWSFSGVFSIGSLVYLSHSASEQLPSPTNSAGLWVQQSYLDVIDYADPLSPTARVPVTIPGTLRGRFPRRRAALHPRLPLERRSNL